MKRIENAPQRKYMLVCSCAEYDYQEDDLETCAFPVGEEDSVEDCLMIAKGTIANRAADFAEYTGDKEDMLRFMDAATFSETLTDDSFGFVGASRVVGSVRYRDLRKKEDIEFLAIRIA